MLYHRTKNGRLYLGDCEDILPKLDRKFDIVITDPPYGVSKSSKWDVDFPSKDTWSTIKSTMNNGASIVTFTGEVNLPVKINLLSSVFNYQGVMVWYKPNAMQFGKTGFTKQSLLWWFSKNDCKFKSKKMVDVVVVPMMKKEDWNINHPTPKPLDIYRYLVKGFGIKNGTTILDPFFGSGSLGVVCEQQKLTYIGIERNIDYAKEAVRRIKAVNNS